MPIILQDNNPRWKEDVKLMAITYDEPTSETVWAVIGKYSEVEKPGYIKLPSDIEMYKCEIPHLDSSDIENGWKQCYKANINWWVADQ